MIAADCGDSEACRQLVEAFLPAIGNLARGFQSASIERPELLQEGVAGLLFAARRYDPGLATPFWGYASFSVRKAMQELVAELTRPVALQIAPSGSSPASGMRGATICACMAPIPARTNSASPPG